MTEDVEARIRSLEVDSAVMKSDIGTIRDVIQELRPMVVETHTRVTQIGAFSAALAALVSFIWGVVLAIMAFFKDRVN